MCKCICSSIKCYIFGSVRDELVLDENDLPICHCLIIILAAAALGNHNRRTCI